ncbi:rod-determining factor RdfA [Natrinema sp. 1APR25-10V2]|uniref:rod-determining factor RdfA n=1 Tax=Natrinema sp. 1APR25-10V2 TaxID=2951081 RepID=UPI00287512EE|nr:rod-determining factor RdfA [Natrinema sp. 1APR25-10V2]MDS0477333.1 hypothetical protein [Natrinema sp. 1APR25-10V2]
MGTKEHNGDPQTKVGRLIEEYNFDGFGGELERMWTASGDERKSLRDLADIFNKRILQSTIDESGVTRLDTDVDNIYLQLKGEKGTSADQTRIRRRLEREGIDVEALQSDFVTYAAIRSYLKEERNAEYNPSQNPVTRDKNSIQQLRSRTRLVTETKLNGLVENDQIELGSHEVTVDINVFCEDCGRQFDVIDLLDQKKCECKS